MIGQVEIFSITFTIAINHFPEVTSTVIAVISNPQSWYVPSENVSKRNEDEKCKTVCGVHNDMKKAV